MPSCCGRGSEYYFKGTEPASPCGGTYAAYAAQNPVPYATLAPYATLPPYATEPPVAAGVSGGASAARLRPIRRPIPRLRPTPPRSPRLCASQTAMRTADRTGLSRSETVVVIAARMVRWLRP